MIICLFEQSIKSESERLHFVTEGDYLLGRSEKGSVFSIPSQRIHFFIQKILQTGLSFRRIDLRVVEYFNAFSFFFTLMRFVQLNIGCKSRHIIFLSRKCFFLLLKTYVVESRDILFVFFTVFNY